MKRRTNENLFKKISNPVTDPSFYLNRQCTDETCFYIQDPRDPDSLNQNLIKIYESLLVDLYDWEMYCYNKFKCITPVILNYTGTEIEFSLRNMLSLRFILKGIADRKIRGKTLLNELVCFVRKLNTTHCLLHGNLTIDHIFVDTTCARFYVVEFGTAKIKKTPFVIFADTDLRFLIKNILETFPDFEYNSYLNSLLE